MQTCVAGDTDLVKWDTESLVSAPLISDLLCSKTLTQER